MFSPHTQTPQQCLLCQGGSMGFTSLISHSLSGKYSSTQNFYYTKEIEQILGEELCHNYIQFSENNYIDDDEEYLKRQYGLEQFPKKIEMLSEYYKYHRNQPLCVQKSIEPVMTRYYAKVKDYDYKKIKQILKKQQNVSISTHKSFSSLDDSEFTKKSRYSTMLHDISIRQNESELLLQMCDRIGKALKKVKPQQFKGQYYSGQNKFQEYLKKQKKRKDHGPKKQQTKKPSFSYKKLKFNKKLLTKDDEAVKSIKFQSAHSLHSRQILKHKQLSIEKTANDTASREERIRREKLVKTLHPKLSKASNLRDKFMSQATVQSRQLGVINLKSITQQNIKTVNQIYQAVSSRVEINHKKNIKNEGKGLKYRSNSSHTLQNHRQPELTTDRKHKKYKQKRLSKDVSERSCHKKISISVAQLSTINPFDKQYKSEKSDRKIKRDKSHRIMRSNSEQRMSSRKRTNHHQAKKGVDEQDTKAKKKTIQNMLEKKLELYKSNELFR